MRKRRDLLESIIFPNASIARSYESVEVITGDSRRIRGFVREESDDTIRIVAGADQEHTIDRRDIVVLKAIPDSIMPAGLDRQLTEREIADLLAFLESTRWR